MSSTKAELRTSYLANRKALSADELNRRNALLLTRFVDFVQQQTQTRSLQLVHTFLPIRRQNEVDTWPLIHWLWQYGVSTAVSVTDTETNQLMHYPLTADTVLTENKWGIPEPVIRTQPTIDPTAIDMVLVPLLAFDRQGHRVGYGKGYYDRFLANCRPDCLTVGLSLFEPVERITDVSDTDVPLSHCLTPTTTLRFK